MKKHKLGGYEISVIAVDEAKELYSNKSLRELFEYTKMHDQVLLTVDSSPKEWSLSTQTYSRLGSQFFKKIVP
jgi:hypothetical protein